MHPSTTRGLLALCAVTALAACGADSDATSPTGGPALVAAAGNGAPSGAHYNLNIIGVPRTKSADMTGDNGRRIFVSLGRDGEAANTRINLTEGDDFAVLDANGTDGTASFQLPNPDPDGDGTTAYSVYVRALGKPGGKATMQTCYDDAQTGETWCAVDYVGGVEPVELESKAGRSKFENVSKDLLYVDVCTDYDATTETCLAWDQLPLFSDENDDYFWSYDNQGLKLAQLRFYEVPTVTGF
jgi:hypothetical protein